VEGGIVNKKSIKAGAEGTETAAEQQESFGEKLDVSVLKTQSGKRKNCNTSITTKEKKVSS